MSKAIGVLPTHYQTNNKDRKRVDIKIVRNFSIKLKQI